MSRGIIKTENAMHKAKKGKWIAVTLAGLFVLISLGIVTGSVDRIIDACKAFIYCNASELLDKTGQHK